MQIFSMIPSYATPSIIMKNVSISHDAVALLFAPRQKLCYLQFEASFGEAVLFMNTVGCPSVLLEAESERSLYSLSFSHDMLKERNSVEATKKITYSSFSVHIGLFLI